MTSGEVGAVRHDVLGAHWGVATIRVALFEGRFW
jgi:hypothetical protein